jgi:hypothetical protein
MKAKRKNRAVGHTGSTFDNFLEEEGIREEVDAVAVKRVISWQPWRVSTHAQAVMLAVRAWA